jgi:hypothetical protein
MSSGDVICKAHEIVSNVLNADQYAMRSLEELVPGSRKKKDQVKDTGPIHKKVVGLFTPADSQAVADSFSEVGRLYNATHLFVCPEDGCSRRFASHAWLATHLKSVHRIVLDALSPAQEAHRKQLMEQQKQAKDNCVAHERLPCVDVADEDSESLAVAPDNNPHWECQHPPACHVQGHGLDELWQHYALAHPSFINYGFSVDNLTTGMACRPDSDHVPLDDHAAGFIKLAMIDINECNAESLDYQLNWLYNHEESCGLFSDSAEAHKAYVLDHQIHRLEEREDISASGVHLSPSPPAQREAKQKRRKCSKCNGYGHQKNSVKCPFNRDDFLLSDEDETQNTSFTPSTAPNSPM